VELHDPAAVKALDTFQVKQSAWLETERQLSQSAADPQGLTGMSAALLELSSGSIVI
jgi:hypothetical protein